MENRNQNRPFRVRARCFRCGRFYRKCWRGVYGFFGRRNRFGNQTFTIADSSCDWNEPEGEKK